MPEPSADLLTVHCAECGAVLTPGALGQYLNERDQAICAACNLSLRHAWSVTDPGPAPSQAPKTWKDLQVAEQVARLREVLKDLQRTVSYEAQARRGLEQFVRDLLDHHHVEGRVVGPIRADNLHGGDGSMKCGTIQREGYF